jgi:hypothetical protein
MLFAPASRHKRMPGMHLKGSADQRFRPASLAWGKGFVSPGINGSNTIIIPPNPYRQSTFLAVLRGICMLPAQSSLETAQAYKNLRAYDEKPVWAMEIHDV